MSFYRLIQIITHFHSNWFVSNIEGYSLFNVRWMVFWFLPFIGRWSSLPVMVFVIVVNIFTYMAMLDSNEWVSIEIISNVNCVIIFLIEEETKSWKQTINYSWHMHAIHIDCWLCLCMLLKLLWVFQCFHNNIHYSVNPHCE